MRAVHTIHASQHLPITLEEAWEFFSTPHNLEALTPCDLSFQILSSSHETMVEGQIISYAIQLFPLIKMPWITEITHVKDQQYFIDDQRKGPYALWHHRHEFEETPNGVLMRDILHYTLPFGFLGKIAHALFVKKKLRAIFSYRQNMLLERFGANSQPPTLDFA